MTATLPVRAHAGSRRGHAYAYLTLAHADRSRIEFGYGGQSFQRHGARDRQHRECQPWEDLIVGSPLVIADGWFTPDELDAVEEAVIQGRWGDVRRLADGCGAVVSEAAIQACVNAGGRPRYNWALNEDNPRQVPKLVAVEQRWVRDDAAGRPRWVPVEARPGAVVPGLGWSRPAWWHRSRWTGWHVTVPAWVVLSVLVWGYVRAPWAWFWVTLGEPQVAPWSPLLAAAGAALFVTWGWDTGWRQARKRRRR